MRAKRRVSAEWAAAFLAAVSLVSSTAAGAAPPPSAAASAPQPYLASDGLADPVLILPPPPAPGSPEDEADHKIFEATRSLQGSQRWALAARDATNYIGAFDCALGLELGPRATPKTLALLRRVGVDAARLVDRAKDHYARARPFVSEEGAICVEAQRAALARSFSYPSGHATFSAAAGLILAELAPDRAAQILARARAFAESRVVCGVHYLSDINSGEANGAALVALLQADPAFRADMASAGAELARLRERPAPPDGAECQVEASASEHTPWTNPDRPK